VPSSEEEECLCEGEEECEDCSEEPVRCVNGKVQIRGADLASGGFGGSWSHDRVYSNCPAFTNATF